jgi:hypothetical protein
VVVADNEGRMRLRDLLLELLHYLIPDEADRLEMDQRGLEYRRTLGQRQGEDLTELVRGG